MSLSRPSVCVILGANFGSDLSYTQSAKQLGILIAKKKVKLIYGGGKLGLMGVLADTVIENGGEVVGVITKDLYENEGHLGLSKLYTVETMQERKIMMAKLSDGCIALPGGLGTLEEFFEFWNASKLGLYSNPIALLNIDGFFNHLISFVELSVEKGFLKNEHFKKLILSADPNEILDDIFKDHPLFKIEPIQDNKKMSFFGK